MKATLEQKMPINLSIIGLPMISPDSLFAMMWISFIALMDMTYTAYWVPINVAFCSTDYGDLSSNCTAADLAGGIVYALHLFLSFHFGTVMFHGYRKKLIMDGFLVARIYTRHGRFLLDLISVLPFFYLVVIIAGNYVAIRWVAIVSLFRLVRLARLFSIGNIILDDIQRGDKNSPVARFFGGSTPAYLFIICFFATAIINMEGCLMVLVSNFIGKENSWMTSLDWIDIPNASSLYHWYYGIYTAIASVPFMARK
ncbi:hypothetical protein DUNSADRAFT_12283 [Dunaliella salina]|uniref:Uncharacterized protein n=1 Tax=Dunaliella salina TaxID=3046 RepID=A0ABQ7H410_DUNSA|nr:hypothetical protein DUNSADRAFT_12283 [Dunaliella salina]|eukprot:KAF5841585.1 hypothetical protein DUNSADRAFT_12283 [Dunaliella salina]